MTNTAFILWLQQFQPPFLVAVFRGITSLGGETFFTLALPVLYWCYDKGFALGLGTIFLSSSWLNGWLKNLFHIPRPTMAQVRVLDNPGGYSFPSGHAQGSGTFWTYCATRIKRRWFTVTAAVAIFLISLSRPYLGVHYLTDIVAGASLGIGLALAYAYAERRKWRIQTWAYVVFPLLMAVIDRTPDSAKVAGVLLGLGLGARADEATLDFKVATKKPWFQVAKLVVGLTIVLALRFGLKAILPTGVALDFVRYAVIGGASSYGVPYLFVRLGWAERGVGPT